MDLPFDLIVGAGVAIAGLVGGLIGRKTKEIAVVNRSAKKISVANRHYSLVTKDDMGGKTRQIYVNDDDPNDRLVLKE